MKMERKISLSPFFDLVGTYDKLKQVKENPIPEISPELIEYMENIEKKAEQNAETWRLHDFIVQWVDSRGRGHYHKIQRFAVLLPDEMPWGVMATVFSILLNNNEPLSRIAEALREEGIPVFHNWTGIDDYNPRAKVKVFLFENTDEHLIWFLKRA
jgi:hypothetical protein